MGPVGFLLFEALSMLLVSTGASPQARLASLFYLESDAWRKDNMGTLAILSGLEIRDINHGCTKIKRLIIAYYIK